MRFRMSFRFKLLLVISSVMLLAIASFLYLATNLFSKDKLAYVFDLNASREGVFLRLVPARSRR